MSERAERKVACPSCGATSSLSPANRWRPFCSERCKLIDLGNWASEQYRVPEVNPPSPEDKQEES